MNLRFFSKDKNSNGIYRSFVRIVLRGTTTGTTKVYIKEAGKEAGWLGNEIAWARDSTPDGNIAVFVEKGAEATGLAKVIADNLQFDHADLSGCAPRVIEYLCDLKRRVLSP